jgi:hydroxymethylglutaryl-CoA lyase
MNLPSKIKIREVGPRDGFQIQKAFIPTKDKIYIIKALVAAGVSNVEATAFVSPKAVPQMRDAAEIIKAVPRNESVYSALVPNLRGAQDAIAAGVDEIVIVISASNAHNLANLNRTVDRSIADLDGIFSLAAEQGIRMIASIATAFGCPYVPKASGNLPTEDVVYMLDDMGIETGINLEAMILAALQLEKILGKMLSGQVMKSGPSDPERAAELCGINH